MSDPDNTEIIDDRYVITTFYDDEGRVTGSTIGIGPWVVNDDA